MLGKRLGMLAGVLLAANMGLGCNDGGDDALNARDWDRDEVADGFDNCAYIANGAQDDVDGDGVGDQCDVCPTTPDPEQADSDEDGVGDACTPPGDDGGCTDPDGCDPGGGGGGVGPFPIKGIIPPGAPNPG